MQKKNIKILVVDDVQSSLSAVEKGLSKTGYTVISTTNPHEALSFIRDDDFHIVVTDLKMPELEGTDILRAVKEKQPATEVIVMTGYSSVESAVDLMNEGAFYYLKKPININELRELVIKALEGQELVFQPEEKFSESKFITASQEMKQIVSELKKVAKGKSTILVTGESGTGKEILSRMIHEMSPRADKPFIAINCSAFSDSLLESQLFGYEKGAFTGADTLKTGLFESAHLGTIFLDEVAEMSLSMQAKLLRVIETKEFMRVGGIQPVSVDVRIIAATHKQLKEEVDLGHFREDLFYRLSVIQYSIPPLRERKEDIPLLVDYFLNGLAEENQSLRKNVSKSAIEALQEYDWHGNVRELRNIIERVYFTSDESIIKRKTIEKYLSDMNSDQQDVSFNIGETLSDIEEKAIVETLRYTKGNRTKAAEILKIGLRTLQRKLKEYQGKGEDL